MTEYARCHLLLQPAFAIIMCHTRVPTVMINITCICCFNIQVLILGKWPLDLNIVSVSATGSVCKLVTQSCESQTQHVTLAISWRAGISGYQIGTVAPKSMLKPVYKYPLKYTICESISCILFVSKSWHLLQLPVLTYCPEAHLFMAGYISWWWWQGPVYLWQHLPSSDTMLPCSKF